MLADELAESENYLGPLELIESDVRLAAQLCEEFWILFAEKKILPSDNHEANKVLLDKLAELRAITGLFSLGFSGVRCLRPPGPDLFSTRNGRTYAVEVTRLGSSQGKRSQVWDSKTALPHGSSIALMSQHGAAPVAIAEAVYREIEEKSRQLKNHDLSHTILWVSLGRDYLTAGKYELEGVGTLRLMRRTLTDAVAHAMVSVKESGLCAHIDHVVLGLGRDTDDIVWPPI